MEPVPGARGRTLRIHFRARPWDLYGTIGYTFVTAALLVPTNTGSLFGIMIVFFVPGYVSVAALFPGSKEIDWFERVGLSFGVSLAVVPLLGLLLNVTPWGIRLDSIVVAIVLFTVGVGYVAYLRRMRLPPNLRLGGTLDIGFPTWRGHSFLDKGLTIALSASIVVAGGTLAYAILTPRASETSTEFYILGPGGNASGYPTALKVSQLGAVILGIANHEFASVNYTVRVDLVGVRRVYNATSGFNETFEVNRTTWSTLNVTLIDGRNWTEPYAFRVNGTGLWKVQFLLFKDGDFSSAYRELHLFIRVT